jgi:TonB-linked SusC/RagA family outer membrane protein
MFKFTKSIFALLLVAAIGLPSDTFAAPSNNPAIAQQSAQVRGKVKSGAEAVIGATVMVKGTTNGAATDLNGEFSINIKRGETLVVSSVGYLTQEIKYTGQSFLNIELKEDTKNLEEVVVVGYGTQKKANLTGSVANVDNKLLDNRPLTNLSSGLAGLLPGVQVLQTSGQPGQDIGKITVRGVGTINNASPMVLIDGVEGSLNDVDPSDVQSISVLKDAASSAIYGSKAANGVILVTTKRGTTGKTTVSYSGLFGFTSATNTPEFMSSGEIARKWNEVRTYEGKLTPIYSDADIAKYENGSDPDNYPNTDWIDLLYRTSTQTSHNVSFTGGTENARYMASVGYLYQDGIVKNYNKNQYSGRLNLDINPVKNLETSFSMSYMRQDVTEPLPAYQTTNSTSDSYASTNSVYQIFRLVNRISPMVTAKYSDGTYGSVSDGNPLAWVESEARGLTKTHNLLAIGSAKYTFLPGLSLKAVFAYNMHNIDRSEHAIQAVYRSGTQGTTFAAQSYSNYDRVTFDLTPEYKASFGKHNIDLLAGFHSEMYKYKYTYAYREGMANTILTDINAGSSSTAKAQGYKRELAMMSWFGRLDYDYAGKYLFEVNARYDGSSRFAKDNRWGFFPSVSAGWRISEENFFAPMRDWVSNLKLRASWGKLGNQDIGSYYPTVSTMSLGYGYTYGGTYNAGAETYNAVNKNLKWEATTTWGIGLDATIKKVDLTIDFYNKTTSDILMKVNTPVTYALSNYYDNIGKIRNRGIELSLNYRDQYGPVSFEAGANIAYNKSKVLDLGGETYVDGYSGNDCYYALDWVGHRLNTFYGYKTAGFFQTQSELDSWPTYSMDKQTRRLGDMKYVDADGSKTVDSNDRCIEGSMDPSWTFGFHLNVGYKNFDVIAFFQGAADVYRYVSEGLGSLSASTSKLNTLWRDSWTPENTGAKYPRVSEYGVSNTQYCDFWLQNASYLRMKDLQVGYTFPKSILNKIGISKLRIYYSGQNLFTITGMLKGWDPEGPSGRGNGYPQTKINSIGVNLTF